MKKSLSSCCVADAQYLKSGSIGRQPSGPTAAVGANQALSLEFALHEDMGEPSPRDAACGASGCPLSTDTRTTSLARRSGPAGARRSGEC